jgi:hypothetical protein
MSYQDINEVVAEAISSTPNWTGYVMELDDNFKDILCAKWLSSHPTWLDDIFPHTCSDRYDLALHMTYGMSSSRMLAAFFRDAADYHKKDVDNDAFWSEALWNFENIMDDPDFCSIVRDRIYLYLERTLEEKVMDSFQDLMEDYKQNQGVH